MSKIISYLGKNVSKKEIKETESENWEKSRDSSIIDIKMVEENQETIEDIKENAIIINPIRAKIQVQFRVSFIEE